VRLFLNGEYWGIYFLREHMDRHYLAQHFDVDEDSIDLIKNYHLACCIEGSNVHYLNVLSFFENNDISIPENYEYIQSQVDVDNFMDYLILRLYCSDIDWPDNNVRYWRPQTPDGKWKWLFYDTDFAFTNASANSVERYFSSEELSQWSVVLGRSLIQNETFKNQFLTRFEYYLNNTLRKDRIVNAVDSLSKEIEPHVQEYIDRFDLPTNMDDWEESVDYMRTNFAVFRPCRIETQLLETLEGMISIDSCFYATEPEDSIPLNIDHIEDPFFDQWSLQINQQSVIINCGNCFNLERSTFEVYDVSGKIVLEKSFENSHLETTLPFLPKGIYICKLNNKNGAFTQKIFWGN